MRDTVTSLLRYQNFTCCEMQEVYRNEQKRKME